MHESNAAFSAIFNIDAPSAFVVLASILLKVIYILVVLIQYLLFEYFIRNIHKSNKKKITRTLRNTFQREIRNVCVALLQFIVFPKIIASSHYSYQNTTSDGRVAARALQFLGFYSLIYIAVVLLVINNIMVIIELANWCNMANVITIISNIYAANIFIAMVYVPMSTFLARKIVMKYRNDKIVKMVAWQANKQ